MSPILGIYASQISGHLFAPSGAYDSIATTTLSSPAASITFSSIPATYTHLQIRGIARSTAAAGNVSIAYNSDTGSNYAGHDLYGDGATAAAGGGGSRVPSNIGVIAVPVSTDLANSFGVGVVDILDYSSTTKYKTVRVLTGFDVNGSGGYILFRSELWMNTNAISTITMSLANFDTYSSVALYGIKGN